MSSDATSRPERPKVRPVPVLPELGPNPTLLEVLLYANKLADVYDVRLDNANAMILDLLDVVMSYPEGRLRYQKIQERNKAVDALTERGSETAG